MWVEDEFGWVDIRKYKVTGTFECVLTSDDENIDQAIKDWIRIEDDEDYINGFKIDVSDIVKLKEKEE